MLKPLVFIWTQLSTILNYDSTITQLNTTHQNDYNNLVSAVLTVQQHTFLFLSTAPPSISEIIQPNIMYAQEPAELKCIIKEAKEWELKVKWFRLNDTDSAVHQSESDSLLSSDLSDQASLQSYGRHHISVLTVCLAVTEDQAKYRCLVHCRGKFFSKETTVQLRGE